MFFEEINRAVDGYQVHAGINLLRALQNLVHIQCCSASSITCKITRRCRVKRMRRFPSACCSLPVV